MINTVNIKQAQLRDGFFKTGTGPDIIFIMGSCRVCHYVNYFADMPQFTVYSIDPFNWNWDAEDNRVDYATALQRMESHEGLLLMMKSCKIFVHEYYANAGMFNVMMDGKNIYDHGMNPTVLDICIPNFNDLFILYKDIVTFDSDMRKLAAQDMNVLGRLSYQTQDAIREISNRNIQKFYTICELSDVPEMGKYFAENYRKMRLFWNYNHVTKYFTLAVFSMINIRFFSNTLTVNLSHEDIFANNYTHLTEYDDFEWAEQKINFKL